jgi:hypothetical protein
VVTNYESKRDLYRHATYEGCAGCTFVQIDIFEIGIDIFIQRFLYLKFCNTPVKKKYYSNQIDKHLFTGFTTTATTGNK